MFLSKKLTTHSLRMIMEVKTMNYKITRDSSYQGITPQREDDLQHFKYVKREKGKNGKWVYYYDDDAYKKKHDTKNNTDPEEPTVIGWDEISDVIDKFEYSLNNSKTGKKFNATMDKISDLVTNNLYKPINKLSDKIEKGLEKVSEFLSKPY